ncbi:Holliday junction resolvase RuvX [Buchnera aphidicola]|uniref:Holliday junction resolvase RuvX n=1 Tax=Buchnera aphidicola TaxID=9 RepID=UPI0030EBA92B
MIIIAIDFGTSKIGLAVGQKITKTINLIKPIIFHKNIINWMKIKKVIHEWKPTSIVIGLPLKMNGKKQKTTHKAENFSKKIYKKFNIKTYMHDERLTTFEAKLIIKKNKNFKKKIKYIDSISAALILKSWFLNT